MELSRKSILSGGCAIVLTSGLSILLVLLAALPMSYFPASIQKLILISIFAFLSIVALPLISIKLHQLPDEKKLLGWTFIGVGVEFLSFPFMVLIFILNFSSIVSIVIGGSIMILSLIFGLFAGLISIIMGISLVKKKIR